MSRLLGERGSGTILMAGIMGVVVTLGAMAMVVAGYVVGYHRALFNPAVRRASAHESPPAVDAAAPLSAARSAAARAR